MHPDRTCAGAYRVRRRRRSRLSRPTTAAAAPSLAAVALAPSEIELPARPAQRVKKQMTASFPPLRAVPGADGRACRTAGCPLPAWESRSLCDPCEAVYAAAFALHEALIERNGARMEREFPGIIEATRRALFDPPSAHAGRGAGDPGAAPDPMVFRRLQDARVPIDWQVDRLDAFVEELRSIAIVTERST